MNKAGRAACNGYPDALEEIRTLRAALREIVITANVPEWAISIARRALAEERKESK
jgi:hypothetical protein